MKERRALARCAALLFLFLVQCGAPELPPEGQLLLYVTTDSVLPSASTEPRTMIDPTPLFDRLRVDLFLPGESEPCLDCTRDFALDSALVNAGQASVGIVPRPNSSGYRARVRMFLAEFEVSGQPLPRATLEATVALPPVPAEGIVRGHVFLRSEDVGQPAGTLDAPVEWVEGMPPKNMVASWSGARRTPCEIQPRSDEVCVPGGSYWMGDLAVAGGAEGEDYAQPRLVTVRPFLMQRSEVTVAQMRSSSVVTLDDPHSWSGGYSGVTLEDFCTFSARHGNRDQLPVNCVSFEAARAYCSAQGGDLPTEAQFEYVAGALQRQRYAWGSAEPECEDAVYARGGLRKASSQTSIYPGTCRPENDIGGALPVGSGARDRLLFPDGTELLDLAGNLMEYARDRWNRQSEACWQPSLLRDPACETASEVDGESITLRGGGWMAAPYYLRAAFRRSLPSSAATDFAIFVGFRCVRPAASGASP